MKNKNTKKRNLLPKMQLSLFILLAVFATASVGAKSFVGQTMASSGRLAQASGEVDLVPILNGGLGETMPEGSVMSVEFGADGYQGKNVPTFWIKTSWKGPDDEDFSNGSNWVIENGEERKITMPLPGLKPGENTLKIEVDFKNEVKETNENNNIVTKTFIGVHQNVPPTIISFEKVSEKIVKNGTKFDPVRNKYVQVYARQVSFKVKAKDDYYGKIVKIEYDLNNDGKIDKTETSDYRQPIFTFPMSATTYVATVYVYDNEGNKVSKTINGRLNVKQDNEEEDEDSAGYFMSRYDQKKSDGSYFIVNGIPVAVKENGKYIIKGKINGFTKSFRLRGPATYYVPKHNKKGDVQFVRFEGCKKMLSGVSNACVVSGDEKITAIYHYYPNWIGAGIGDNTSDDVSQNEDTSASNSGVGICRAPKETNNYYIKGEGVKRLCEATHSYEDRNFTCNGKMSPREGKLYEGKWTAKVDLNAVGIGAGVIKEVTNLHIEGGVVVGYDTDNANAAVNCVYAEGETSGKCNLREDIEGGNFKEYIFAVKSIANGSYNGDYKWYGCNNEIIVGKNTLCKVSHYGKNNKKGGVKIGVDFSDYGTREWRQSSVASLGGGVFYGNIVTGWKVTYSDIDSDGDIDIIFGTHDTGVLAWLENTNGSFNRHQIGNGLGVIQLIEAFDIDGDGDVDIYAAGSQNLYWFENDSNKFTKHAISGVDGHSRYTGKMSGDIDGDGDIDILVTTWAGKGQVNWLENDGRGNFSRHKIFAKGMISGANLADIDGDDDLDIEIMVSYISDFGSKDYRNALYWLENDDGEFTPHEIDSFSELPAFRDIRSGDIDGDGDADIIVAVTGNPLKYIGGDKLGPKEVLIYENDGRQNFVLRTLETNLPSQVADLDNLELVDMDRDDDLDVVVAPSGGWWPSWFENDGNGYFPVEHEIASPRNFISGQKADQAKYTDFAMVDLDDDGLLEMVTVGDIYVRVLKNVEAGECRLD